MDADVRKRKELWDWCLASLRQGGCWRFDGPAATDEAVILEVHNIRWDGELRCYEIEFENTYTVDTSGAERLSLPDGTAPLPEWFKEFQKETGNTLFFMLSPIFKEQVDAGRIRETVKPRLA